MRRDRLQPLRDLPIYGVAARARTYSMHYASCRIGRAFTQIRPRRKMHDFGDLGRALEMVALLPGVALGG